MSIKLYGFATPNMVKVLLTAEQLGLDYEYVHLNPAEGEIKTPEHLARHPLGKIPVLEDGDFTLYESAAICRYMASKAGSSMYGGDDKTRAIIDQWIDFICHHIGKWIGIHFFEEIVKNRFFGKDIDEANMKEAKDYLEEQLPVLEKHLGENRYIAGGNPTIADAIAFAYFNISDVTSFEFNDYPSINRWYEEINSSAACKNTFAHFDGNKIIH